MDILLCCVMVECFRHGDFFNLDIITDMQTFITWSTQDTSRVTAMEVR